MSELMLKILESKRQMRRRLAAMTFSEKVAILERLRERSALIAASPLRRSVEASRRKTKA